MADDLLHASSADSDRDYATVIGTNLRRFRAQSDLSLEKLSRIANVSRAMLGQIELGKSVPTITVLARIADALERPVAAFIGRHQYSPVTVLPVREAKVLRTPDGLFVSRALFPFNGSRKVEFYELNLEPGCVQRSEPHAAGTTENLVVAQGALELSVGQDRYRLEQGDAAFFAADVGHAYANPGTAAAQVYLVMSYAGSISY